MTAYAETGRSISFSVQHHLGCKLHDVIRCQGCATPCRRLQVYKAVLRDTGEEVAVKVQRPNVAPVILRDLFIFRSMARFINPVCKARPPGRRGT